MKTVRWYVSGRHVRNTSGMGRRSSWGLWDRWEGSCRKPTCSSEPLRHDSSRSALFSELTLAVPLSANSTERRLLGLGHLWWAGGSKAGPGNRADVSHSTEAKLRPSPHMQHRWLRVRLNQDHEVALNPLPYSPAAACEGKVGCRSRFQPSCLGAARGWESTVPLGWIDTPLQGLVAFIDTRRRSIFEINNVQGTSLAVLQWLIYVPSCSLPSGVQGTYAIQVTWRCLCVSLVWPCGRIHPKSTERIQVTVVV